MSTNRYILVHGFNVKDDGVGTTGQLAAKIRKETPNAEVIEFKPGWRGLWGVRTSNKRRAQQLAKLIKPGDLLIGHSDGCNLIDMACHELNSFHEGKVNCVYFNPALDRDTALSPIVTKCVVFHTKSDRTVWLSKHLPLHRWGEMGQEGYAAQRKELFDDRYINVSYESMGHSDLEHSGVFKRAAALKDCHTRIQIELGDIPKAIPVEE